MRSRYEVANLTVLKYYLLVLASITGLSTLLGLTQIIDAREGLEPEEAALAESHALHPSAPILDYVARRAGGPITLVRRFEYHFKLTDLRVVMLHYSSSGDAATGRAPALHLVEVYDTGRRGRPLLASASALASAVVLAAAVAVARRVRFF